MSRRVALAAWSAASLAAVALAAPVATRAAAQVASAPVIPHTPAGDVLRAWLAINPADGLDTARLVAYARRYRPDVTYDLQRERAFSERTGGFELLTIERSEPRHIEFTLQERKSRMTLYGLFELSPTMPSRVMPSSRMWVLGENATTAVIRIDAATRARVIATAAALLDSFYVFPDLGKRMGDTLRARLASGAYETATNGIAFALRLRDDLRDIAHDKHLDVNYVVRAMPGPPTGTAPAPPPEALARRQQQMDEINCGFQKAERLDGNVGYLKFDLFPDPEACASTVAAAMTFLAGTRALIIDLRDNSGGSPDMVTLVASYLFSKRTHLNDLWIRPTVKTDEFWTRDTVPGRRFGGEKPVYVLTSSRTFSGGEEFAYDLKSLARAIIVGETTGGGAHPVAPHRIDDHFGISVPFARAVNPITHTNWEGVGVEPDVKVAAGDALASALVLVREKLRQ